MYLSRLLVRNYRSIKQLDLRFKKGKNVIVGRNNAGKSNIIKAIDLILGDSSPTYEKSENISENDFFKGDTSQEIIIFCELTRDQDESLDYAEIYKCFGYKIHCKIAGWNQSGSKNVPIKKPIRIPLVYEDLDIFFGEVRDSFGLTEDGNSDYVNPKLKHQKTFENQFDDKFHFAYAFIAYKDGDGKIQKDIRFFYRENDNSEWIMAFTAPIRNQFLQSAIIPSFRDPQSQLRITNWSWYGKLLKSSIDPENPRLKKAFKEVKEASNEVFSDLQQKINHSKAKIAFPNTTISFQFNPDTKQDVFKSALIYVNDGFNSQLQDKGSGIQSAVIIGLFDFYTREIAHSGNSLLAIEEPELYLHPHGRRVISNRLDDFLDGGKNQVIITTHSPEFINSSQESLNIVVVRVDKQNGTCAWNASFDTAKEKQVLIKNQNAEMFFADSVILGEGGGDKYLLEAIAEEYGAEKENVGKNWLNDHNISVISVSGKTEFWKYAKKLDEVGIAWYIIADFDFFLAALGDFLTKMGYRELKEEHNAINGEIGRAQVKEKRMQELPDDLQEKVSNFFKKLITYRVCILSGELEHYYTDTGKKTIEGISGKEEKALHIVSRKMEEGKSISKYIDIEEYNSFLSLLEKYIPNPPITTTDEPPEESIPF